MEHPKSNKFAKVGNCAHRGGQEGALEAPRMPGRELATRTEPEKIREGMGDKRGRSMEKTGEEPISIGKGQERTWKGRGRTREVSYMMQRTCSIQFGSTYMQQCIYSFMLSVSVLDQVGSNFDSN